MGITMIAAARATGVALAFATAVGSPVTAVTLKPQTSAAFDQYVAESERQSSRTLTDAAGFLWVDRAGRPNDFAPLRNGDVVIDRLETRIDARRIDVPDGLIHHWIGVVFVPGATLDEAVAMLQDYNRHEVFFAPGVAKSRLLERDGDFFRISLRLQLKRIIRIVVNSDHEARYTRPGPDRVFSRVVSTRIAEVEDPDTPDEKELPAGEGGLWRFNTNWRFLERDGGTYVQCESLSLTRTIPLLLRPIIRPLVNSIPRDALTFTLKAARTELMKRAA